MGTIKQLSEEVLAERAAATRDYHEAERRKLENMQKLRAARLEREEA